MLSTRATYGYDQRCSPSIIDARNSVFLLPLRRENRRPSTCFRALQMIGFSRRSGLRRVSVIEPICLYINKKYNGKLKTCPQSEARTRRACLCFFFFSFCRSYAILRVAAGWRERERERGTEREKCAKDENYFCVDISMGFIVRSDDCLALHHLSNGILLV
jgi:hypothetical protein